MRPETSIQKIFISKSNETRKSTKLAGSSQKHHPRRSVSQLGRTVEIEVLISSFLMYGIVRHCEEYRKNIPINFAGMRIIIYRPGCSPLFFRNAERSELLSELTVLASHSLSSARRVATQKYECGR